MRPLLVIAVSKDKQGTVPSPHSSILAFSIKPHPLKFHYFPITPQSFQQPLILQDFRNTDN